MLKSKILSSKVTQLNIIGRRKLWYGISLTVLLPLAVCLFVFGLNLGIDFTGGSTVEVKGQTDSAQLTSIFKSNGVEEINITRGQSNWIVGYRLVEEEPTRQKSLETGLKTAGLEVVRFDQIGPSISSDRVSNAFKAIALMSLAVVVYISWAFRTVPKTIGAYKFGLATLVAAFAHDTLFVVGVFAVLGQIVGVQVDSYIVTAILTVIGFSIHDTIVVFDRIREKLINSTAKTKLEDIVDASVNETIVRSFNTSMVIIMVLLALFLFGGQSIRYFVLALLLGMVAGTYSSIFIAAPLLVSWQSQQKTNKIQQ